MKQYLTLLLTVLATLLAAATPPEQSVIIDGVDLPMMKQRLATSDLQPEEGIWYYPAEEMTLAIEKYNGEKNISYRIILVDSPDVELMPGTVIGYIATSVLKNKMKLWLYSERSHLTLTSPLECVATLSSDASTITFEPPRWKVKVRVNVARFLPTIFRGVGITPEKSEEKLPIGFRKIFPADGNGETFSKIRYL
ncbi:MAG: hypothetical protein J6X81_02920 [Muribaculaceae bacterium]|nr:hypothetical protein [Muribaculaceae bacterium]